MPLDICEAKGTEQQSCEVTASERKVGKSGQGKQEQTGASLLAEGSSKLPLDICEAKGTEQQSCEVTASERKVGTAF